MTVLVVIFLMGYLLITLEHVIKIDKTAVSLYFAVLAWVVYGSLTHGQIPMVLGELRHHLAGIAEIVLFLLGAMTIVELISAHNGFRFIIESIRTKSKRKLLWIFCLITFVFSSFLDNLTTTIIMVTLLRKLLEPGKDRLIFASMIIIAANAGGAWSPIGDVTTTMLWIGGQITAGNIIKILLIPSLVCVSIPLIFESFFMKGETNQTGNSEAEKPEPYAKLIFFMGAGALISVPIFKSITHLPPYMGVMFGLAILWIATDILHAVAQRHHLRVGHALGKIDVPSVLFFTGILLSVAALETAGALHLFANWLDSVIPSKDIIVTLMGGFSAVIDNVPLTAAAMGMYDLSLFPTDHKMWEMLAYAAGTGGSMLIIGSAAGVVAMGIEKIDFLWYLRRMSFVAALGYLGGMITYLVMFKIMAE